MRRSLYKERLSELKEFKNKHGNCNVPQIYKPNRKLGRWCTQLRILYKKRDLKTDEIDTLNSLGFIWNGLDFKEEYWNRMYHELIAYKERHGHINVPIKYDINKKLGIWVSTQRVRKIKNKLLQYQLDKLKDIEFVWEFHKTSWDDKFEELIDYKKTHGHCNVKRDQNNSQLAMWVQSQRQRKKQLSKEQIKKLNDVGFIWNTNKHNTQDMFNALKLYKKQHGHCNVPQKYSKNLALGSWVCSRRILHKKGTLQPTQTLKLNELGFVWNTKIKGNK